LHVWPSRRALIKIYRYRTGHSSVRQITVAGLSFSTPLYDR
jgi:hypothetical protein